MKMLIGGKSVDASDGATIDVINPYTGALVDTVPKATKEDADRACEHALAGQRQWGATSLHERMEVIKQWIVLLEEHKQEIGNLLCDEMGKPIHDSIGEVGAVQNWAQLTMHHAPTILGRSFAPGAQPSTTNDLIVTVREPKGVCLAICPANYPISGLALNVVPAMLGGNAVVVKPATTNPLAAIRVIELLVEAGMPADACQVLTGSGAQLGDWLSENPAIASVMMIGSTGVGSAVARRTSPNLAHLTLELGGNDCMLMLDDADLDLSVHHAIEGRMYNAGQICCAPKRLLVPREKKDLFVERLVERLKNDVTTGDPRDANTRIGTLPSEGAAKNVESQVEGAKRQGANVVYGGERDGACYPPTVVDDVTPDMDVARDDEVFGPVFSIIAYDSEDEAIDLVNGTMYGLMSQVMTTDYRRGIQVANRIESGSVIINYNTFSGRTSAQPFGGYKKSGMGRNGISTAIQELTREKTIVMKGFASPVNTNI